jgi:hypothetical protein
MGFGSKMLSSYRLGVLLLQCLSYQTRFGISLIQSKSIENSNKLFRFKLEIDGAGNAETSLA